MLAVFSALPVLGATITVSNTNDSGAGSLRQAIADAAPGDTINFSVTGTITLTSGELLIAKNLAISGPGASNLAISGNNPSRVFEISSATTVTISGLTIQNGNANGDAGGGILNLGTLTVTNSTISGNSAYAGGGIYNYLGTLTVTNSTISSNFAAYSGGGIHIQHGTLTLTNSTISGNSVGYFGGGNSGGGIYNLGTLTVTNSTISGNFAPYGGGIHNNETMAGTNSTISGNSAASYGGGIYQTFTLTLTNSTISGNSAPTGGGIYNDGVLTVTNTTFSGNSAYSGGGIIWSNQPTATLNNSIVANSPSGGNCVGAGHGASLVSRGYNLSDDTTCSSFFIQAGDMNSTPAGLDPNGLQYNGGPTQTIALLATSPAVDAIPLSPTNYCTATDGTTPITTDQRGIARPQGPACDIGAFERVQNPVQAAQTLISTVQTLGLPKGTQQALSSALQGALISLSKGNNTAAIQQLLAFIDQVNALLQSGRLTSGQAAALIASAQQIIQSLGG